MIPPLSKISQTLNPDVNQYLEIKKNEIKVEMNCIGVGTVQLFNPLDQTVTISLNYLRTILGTGASDTSNDYFANNTTITYPQLVKCPLLINSGGPGYLTFPVIKGDECVIFFNDRDIDNWFTTGTQSSAPNSARIHDLNDALVFVGVRSLARSLQTYNLNGPELGNGNAKIAVEDRIKISVGATTLGQGIDDLIQTLIVSGVFPSSITTALAAVQATIDEVIK